MCANKFCGKSLTHSQIDSEIYNVFSTICGTFKKKQNRPGAQFRLWGKVKMEDAAKWVWVLGRGRGRTSSQTHLLPLLSLPSPKKKQRTLGRRGRGGRRVGNYNPKPQTGLGCLRERGWVPSSQKPNSLPLNGCWRQHVKMDHCLIPKPKWGSLLGRSGPLWALGRGPSSKHKFVVFSSQFGHPFL